MEKLSHYVPNFPNWVLYLMDDQGEYKQINRTHFRDGTTKRIAHIIHRYTSSSGENCGLRPYR